MKPAKSVLLTGLLCATLSAGYLASQAKDNKAEVALQAAIKTETVDGNLKGAIEQYKTIAAQPGAGRATVATALLRMGQCHEKLGNAEARTAYERLVRDYADQPEPTKMARERLSALTAGGGGATGRTEVAMRRVWVAGTDEPAGISPDGRYVVFTPSDIRDLWLRDLQSGEKRRITREASWVKWSFASGSALISPDGKRIAYDWWVGSYGELRLSALDGSSMRVLHRGQDGRNMSLRAWMPDSRRLLAVSYDLKDGTYRRHMISLPDDAIRDIGQPEPGDVNWGYPSPDGRHIAYGLKGDIFVYDTATEQDSVLVQNPAADSVTGWTRDGSGIVFVSDRSGTRDLYLLGIENGRPWGDPQMLRRDLGTNTNFDLTRDGRLFRIENTGTENSFVVPVDEQTGKLTGTPSPVDADYPEASWPKWSPDGKLLYYEIYKGPPNDQSGVLFIRSEETGQRREITPKPKLSYWYNPILSPDGRRFAITGIGQNRNFGVFAIDSESGDVSQLAKIPTETTPAQPSQNWSPDGKAIFYNVRALEKIQGKGIIIRRKDLATAEEKEVCRGHHIDMKISPDGTRFVYVRTDGPTKSHVLGILDIQSGKELELWRVPEADSPRISTPTWVPDGKHVLVARDLKQGSDLWRFPAAGGPGEKLHFFPESTWGFVMHPSGKRMAFTQSRTNFEVWVLENFLPPLKVAK
ncbi:MAG: PD40 domain-containing protein [Acidobacteria bacterium]|nr:PD40 domain-containing protein [Acidobacteriota bacterium]MBE3131356.1 PD40 domain-containing protein [Acidobacteriota bacterium]